MNYKDIKMKTINFEQNAPYFFNNIKDVLNQKEELRQSRKLFNLIRKHHSRKMVLAGYPKFYLRVDSFQLKYQNPCVLVARENPNGKVSINFLQE